ncbi:MAG: M48 family metallopeptidase [Ginsengibacter sp.]
MPKVPCILHPLLLVLFFVFTTFLFASSQVFSPATENAAFFKALSTKYEDHYKDELSSLPKENKKDFEEVYKLRWENVKEVFDKKEIYTSAQAQQYLNALVAEIVKANPLLQNQNFNCYFSRSGVPNAGYIGEGIILFNMGLFKRLDNESQAAFILCHEISHFYLQHSEKSIRRYVAAINSQEMQTELRKIKNAEYGKRQQVDDLLKGLTFNIRRHGRDHESEADSMAIEFLHNTRYDVSEALTTLALLDSIDIDTLHIGGCLQKMFDAKDYPFQKRWLAKEEGLLGGHAQLKKDEPLADSLKTHPDCKLRIKFLEPMVSRYCSSTSSKNVVNNSKMIELKNIFSYEIAEFAYTSENYTKSLYYTLELSQGKTADPYLVAQVGKIFNSFYAAQKIHKLGKLIDLPSPYYPGNYNLLLQFVQNLYLENFASISYHFLKQYYPLLDYYPPFTSAYNTSKKISQQ